MPVCKHCKGTGLMPVAVMVMKPVDIRKGRIKYESERVEDLTDRTCVCKGGPKQGEVQVAKRPE